MSKMISVASGFQYSVNIGYDLNNDDKLKNFIPTRSALELLEDILLSTRNNSTDRARVLIGAYGKGKSHIVLTIMAMLMKRDLSLFEKTLPKINDDLELQSCVKNYYDSENKILPIIITGSNTSLTQAFLLALQRTLTENNLLDIMPETNYRAAIHAIERWKKDFPNTFEAFKKLLDVPVSKFISELEDYNITAYEKFERIYPTLTAGSVFNPFLGFDVVELYEGVVKSLRGKGFTGVYVIYDEFSKYLEANISEASVSDTKMLQDFAEKCNRSGNLQMHLMLISHKEISNYIDTLPKQKVDGWRGVSERFTHIHLNNNFSQTYEIIASVIQKNSVMWKQFCHAYKESFDGVTQRYVGHSLFSEMSAMELGTMIRACYPLHPVSIFILPRLSERVAQNERTLFTFLSANGAATLPNFLDRYHDNSFSMITPDMIYDYFEPLFKKEVYSSDLYKTYQLTATILAKIEDDSLESKIVKTLSLIYILEQFEKLAPTHDELVGIFSVGYTVPEVETAIDNLIGKEYVVYLKRSNNYLRLKQTSGVDIQQKIHDMMASPKGKASVKDTLNKVNFDSCVYPSRYNDEREMTRYFSFVFVNATEVSAETNWSVKSENIPGDGVVYGIILHSAENLSEIKEVLDIKQEYRSRLDNVIKDFYIPVLKEATLYKRAVGFFSSTALVEMSLGICGLVKNGGKIQLIASPRLSAEDVAAINEGIRRRDDVIEEALIRELSEPIGFQASERLNLLSNLIASGVLEIKIAFLETDNSVGMFHEKMGLMYDKDNNIIAFSGSMNESFNAFRQNYEAVDVFTSWSNDEERVLAKQSAFNAMWNDYEPSIRVREFPQVSELIVSKYQTSNETDLNLDDSFSDDRLDSLLPADIENNFSGPHIPVKVKMRPYQLEAINNWAENNYRGIFDMATGTGKTYTALAAIAALYKATKQNLAVFIVCPYQHLVEQWKDDIVAFGMKPIVCYSVSTQKNWKERLKTAATSFNLGVQNHFCVVTTNATFSGEYVQSIVKKMHGNVVLVVDEAHNFGAENLSTTLVDNMKYRLALSATIDRHGDSEGTSKLYDYFGEKCIEYTLKDAINNKMLTPYYYYPVVVSLSATELEEYLDITAKIRKNVHADKHGKVVLSEYAKMLLIKRARLVSGAAEKIDVLRELMQDHKDDNHMLVYCGATTMHDVDYKEGKAHIDDIRQIDLVADMLGNDLGMRVSKFTSEENAAERERIKADFDAGDHLQAVVAIRCLDEGVNIPSIKTAFILASSTNPKEYVQRRGRVLRLFNGKNFAVIYDFITLPFALECVDHVDAETLESGNISAEIDRISFELELNSDIDDAQLEQSDFEEEGFEEDNDDDFFDGYDENVDPAIFDDPVLMVKWLEKKQKERDSETLKNQEQERLDAVRQEQERLEAARQEQERIKTERAHLFSQLENTHLTKLKELESRYLAEKKRLHHELLQIEKGIQEKNNQLSKLSFLRFLERRSLTADLEKLGQRKQKLLMLIQDIESMYNEQCNKERTEFSMILAEKGL